MPLISKIKVSMLLPSTLIQTIDDLVTERQFENRSAVFELAIKSFLRERMDAHIEAQVAKLDQALEIAEAEEGLESYSNLISSPMKRS